jgi:hypothetical protein
MSEAPNSLLDLAKTKVLKIIAHTVPYNKNHDFLSQGETQALKDVIFRNLVLEKAK